MIEYIFLRLFNIEDTYIYKQITKQETFLNTVCFYVLNKSRTVQKLYIYNIAYWYIYASQSIDKYN